MLPIALGEATKLAGRMLDADKIYDFTIRFGEETDTLDVEGEVVATSRTARPTLAEIEAVLPRFTGEIEQVPPAYSALKVDGKRAYDLARAGEEVELASRKVIDPRPDRPASQANSGTDRAGRASIPRPLRVSKGTYIRSLARDIAHALGTVGHVTMLRRTQGRAVRPRTGDFAGQTGRNR